MNKPVRFRYQTLDFGANDIHVRTLKNNQQFFDKDDVAAELGISSANWPLFGIIWASGEFLAHLMLTQKIRGLRILEVGCGIGLASLVLNQRNADITATDCHPEVEGFLIENTRINQGRTIKFERTGWVDKSDSLGKFDLIIGSDLLYERGHAKDLSHFIEDHAKASCQVIVVDPNRGHQNTFRNHMQDWGYSYTNEKVDTTLPLRSPFKGNVLQFSRR